MRAVRRALAAAQQSGTPESMTLPAEQAALALHRALVATPPEPTEPAVNALANALLPFRASHHAERKALEEALALIDYAITRAVRRRR